MIVITRYRGHVGGHDLAANPVHVDVVVSLVAVTQAGEHNV